MDDAAEYGFPDERADDYASMLAEVEADADTRTLRLALGVDDRELDLIRIGHPPAPETAERLRALHDLSRKADLTDPRAVTAALFGDERASSDSPAAVLSLLRTGGRVKLLVAAFVAFEVVAAVGIFAFFLVRGL